MRGNNIVSNMVVTNNVVTNVECIFADQNLMEKCLVIRSLRIIFTKAKQEDNL